MAPLEMVARDAFCSPAAGGVGGGGSGAFVRRGAGGGAPAAEELAEEPEADLPDEDLKDAAPAPVSGVGAVPTLSSRGAFFARDPMRNVGESGPVAEGDGGTEEAALLLLDVDADPGAAEEPGPDGEGPRGAGRTRVTEGETRVAADIADGCKTRECCCCCCC